MPRASRAALRAALTIALAHLAGCIDAAPGPRTAGRLAIDIAPLSLAGIADACYTLTVLNGDDAVVSTVTLSSSRYGDGAGSASYVSPCDADPLVADNTVTLAVIGLYTETVADCSAPPASVDFQNPGLLSRSVDCRQNVDTPVSFELALMRPARQGFFDVAVSFADIFCAAKFDCVDATGGPLNLLFDADGDRASTAVFALACTGGSDTATATGDTTLHLDDLVVACGGTPTTVVVDPSAGVGNLYTPAHAAGTSVLYQAQVSAGLEALVDGATGLSANKVYWTVALGVDLGALATATAGCTVSTRFTASRGLNDASWSPPGVYPVIDLAVPLTLDAGALACGGDDRHGLDELGQGYLATTYPASAAPLARCAHDDGAGAVAFCSATSRTVACTGLPAHAAWNTVDTLTQSWDGDAWTPSAVGSYSATPSTTSCVFDCDAGYSWDGGACVAADPYADNVVLLLHMDGDPGGTTFVDSSGHNHTVTPINNAAIGATAKFGTGGAALDATSFLAVTASNDFAFGTGDFTIEFWARPASNTTGALLGMRPVCASSYEGIAIIQAVGSGGAPELRFYVTGTPGVWTVNNVPAADPLPLGVWSHVALVRDGSELRVYINGAVTVLSTTYTGAVSGSSYDLSLGAAARTPCAGYAGYDGALDEWRITTGVARYPAIPSELPPVAGANTALLLHMDGAPGATAFTDELGHTVTAMGGAAVTALAKAGSGALASSPAPDASTTGDYLAVAVANAADLAFGSADFTLEGWVYPNSNTAGGLFGRRYSCAGEYGPLIFQQEAGASAPTLHVIASYTNTTPALNATSALPLSVGAWNHVALVRSGATLSLFVNGARDTLTTGLSGTLYPHPASITIGSPALDCHDWWAYWGYDGRLDEWRLTLGEALYVGDITAPSAAFPNP